MPANNVKAAAGFDLAKLLAKSATVPETDVVVHRDGQALARLRAIATERSKPDADEAALDAEEERLRAQAAASKVIIRVRAVGAEERGRIIVAVPEDKDDPTGEAVIPRRLTALVAAAVVSITDVDGHTNPGPIDADTVSVMRSAMGDLQWSRIQTAVLADVNDEVLDGPFSQASSGATLGSSSD